MTGVAILGATGSIGRSALKVIERHPDRFRVVGLSTHGRVRALARLAERHGAEVAVVADPRALAGADFVDPELGMVWEAGREALVRLSERPDVDVVVNALVGAAGLELTLAALRSGKRVALANKESLVAGGPLVRRAAEEGGGEIVPVDSEHSAILQCLEGSSDGFVSRLILTASGGPFRGWTRDRLWEVTPEEALQHPTWSMGAKITIDSASLANKALEVIEAHFLYQIGYDRIDVVVHPQSIVHSFVEFVDGSVLAQLGEPTMELPILYALCYPERAKDPTLRTFDPVASSPLTFEPVDRDAFPMFGLGVHAGRVGGVAPAVYNAANEVAVQAFLDGRIRFPEIAEAVAHALEKVGGREPRSIADVVEADRTARRVVREAVHTRPESTTRS